MASNRATLPEISIVVATRDRPELLARCLGRLLTQTTERPYEILVVNDGSPFPPLPQLKDDRVAVLVAAGRGPAAARNLGATSARASVLLFTDDDVLPDERWLDAAARVLEQTPSAVGAEGPTDGQSFDRLYEHSIHNDVPGAYFTCNVAYRRDDFLATGGFDVEFPNPHCEDVDLGRRMALRGPVVFVPEMRVVHPPRPIGFWELARRAQLIESEWRLHRKHPDTRPPRWSLRWGPLFRIARRWQQWLFDPSVVRGDVRRAARLVGLAAAQLAIGLHTTLWKWRRATRHG